MCPCELVLRRYTTAYAMTQESQQAAMCENKLKGDSSHQGKREKKNQIMLEKPLMWNSRKHCWDKTTINFQYIYHIAFWLLENSTTLRTPDKCQIQID